VIVDSTKAVLLFLGAAVLGVALLDDARYRRMEWTMQKTIDTRFKEHSTKLGAWVMDRGEVTSRIGMAVEDLPSYKWAEQRIKALEGK
jgi:hypothetical protein